MMNGEEAVFAPRNTECPPGAEVLLSRQQLVLHCKCGRSCDVKSDEKELLLKGTWDLDCNCCCGPKSCQNATCFTLETPQGLQVAQGSLEGPTPCCCGTPTQHLEVTWERGLLGTVWMESSCSFRVTGPDNNTLFNLTPKSKKWWKTNPIMVVVAGQEVGSLDRSMNKFSINLPEHMHVHSKILVVMVACWMRHISQQQGATVAVIAGVAVGVAAGAGVI